MKIKWLRKIVLIGAAPLLAAFAVPTGAAQTMTPDQMRAHYDSAMKHCDTLKGNERDVCGKEAKAQRDSAKADAKAGRKEAEARHDATEEKREGAYSVAKEKCDATSGDAKAQCIAQAKTKYGK